MDKLTKQLIVRVIVTVVGSLIRKTAKIKLPSRFWSLSAAIGQPYIEAPEKINRTASHGNLQKLSEANSARAFGQLWTDPLPCWGQRSWHALGSLSDSLLHQLFVSLSCVSSVGRRSTCVETVEQLSQCVLSTLYNTHYVN